MASLKGKGCLYSLTSVLLFGLLIVFALSSFSRRLDAQGTSDFPVEKRTEILFYTIISRGVYQSEWVSDSSCKGVVPGSCFVHSAKERFNQSGAVVFTGGNPYKMSQSQLQNRGDKILVFSSLEAFSRLPKIKYPEYFFNASMTYSIDADIPFYYKKRLLTRELAEREGFKFNPIEAQKSHSSKKRKHLISAIISNCRTTPSGRTELIRHLEKIGKLNLLGKCSRNETQKTLCKKGDELCVQGIFEDSYFFLALENTICMDYVSEKYWDRVTYDSIPITWSREAFKNLNIPNKSVLFIDDFADLDEFLRHLEHLQSNRTAYGEYFEWRSSYMLMEEESRECLLCRGIQNFKPKTYKNVLADFSKSTQCRGNVVRKLLKQG